MANSYCTSAEYPAARAALDATLTAADLPDATIALPIYATLADLEVKRRVPAHATLAADADLLVQLRAAATLLCAARLSYALPAITEESAGQRDYQYRAEVVDPAARAKALRAQAGALIAYLNGGTGLPTFFTLATGGRAEDRSAIVAPLPAGSVIAGQG